MITRKDVERLASVHTPHQNAVTFYFVPSTPSDRSHRENAILLKDMLRKESHAKGSEADLEKIQARAEELEHSGSAKAIFACGSQGMWEEFDIPERIGATSLHIAHQFHLKPLVALLERSDAVAIVLVDREVNRLLRMQNGRVVEDRFPDQEPREVRTVGTGESTKLERRVEHEVMRHFKSLAAHLLTLRERGEFDLLMVGARDETAPAFIEHLAAPLQQVLIGTFRCDPAHVSLEQVREEASRILEERRANEREGLLREIDGESRRNGKGVIGVNRVLQTIERGEVQHLVVGSQFAVRGVLCPNCDHLDARMLDHCAACGTHTVELEDITDAVIARTFRSKADIALSDDAGFANRIGALLRFRADQNTPAKLAS